MGNYTVALQALPTDSRFVLVQLCRHMFPEPAKPRKRPQVPDPFPSLRVGSGNETNSKCIVTCITNKADDGQSCSNYTRKRVRIPAEEWYLQWTKFTGRLSQVTTYHRTLQKRPNYWVIRRWHKTNRNSAKSIRCSNCSKPFSLIGVITYLCNQ